MMDIVTQLRYAVNKNYDKDPCEIMEESADEIEFLRGQLNLHHDLARANEKIERLREALRSIASNTCCDGCQEAALVARAALKGDE